jgi:hypothetical protein
MPESSIDNSTMRHSPSPIDLLNTPLANTMKKVGMTPLMSGSLNSFVKKKVVNGADNTLNSFSQN